jgi:hypothetical protein
VALRRHATCPRRQPRPRPHQEAGAVAAAPRDVIDRSRGLCGRARLQPKASPKGCRFDRGERHANAKNPLPLSPQALLAAAVSHDEGTRSSAEATPSALNPSTSPSPSSHSSLLFHPHRHPMARSAEALLLRLLPALCLCAAAGAAAVRGCQPEVLAPTISLTCARGLSPTEWCCLALAHAARVGGGERCLCRLAPARPLVRFGGVAFRVSGYRSSDLSMLLLCVFLLSCVSRSSVLVCEIG